MIARVRQFLTNESYKQSSLLTGGALVNSFLGVIFYVFVARGLSVADFGYFSFLLGIALLGADLGDLGLGTAIVRFHSELDFKVVNTLVLAQRGVMAVIFFSLAITASFFNPSNFLLSALLATTLLALFQFTQELLAWQKYPQYVLTNIFGNTVRLAAVFLLISASRLTAESAMMAFVLANVSSLAVAFVVIVKKVGFPFRVSGLHSALQQVGSFSNWLGLSFALGAVSSRIGSPVIYLLAGPVQAGIFSAAYRVTSFFPQVISAVEGVFGPKIASKADVARHQKDYRLLVLFLSVGLIVLLPFSSLIISLIFGPRYEAAAVVLQILLVGTAFFFLAAPFSATILYKYGRSRYHFAGSVVTLVLSLVLYYLLVPRFGAVGAALVSVGSNLALAGTLYTLMNRLENE